MNATAAPNQPRNRRADGHSELEKDGPTDLAHTYNSLSERDLRLIEHGSTLKGDEFYRFARSIPETEGNQSIWILFGCYRAWKRNPEGLTCAGISESFGHTLKRCDMDLSPLDICFSRFGFSNFLEVYSPVVSTPQAVDFLISHFLDPGLPLFARMFALDLVCTEYAVLHDDKYEEPKYWSITPPDTQRRVVKELIRLTRFSFDSESFYCASIRLAGFIYSPNAMTRIAQLLHSHDREILKYTLWFLCPEHAKVTPIENRVLELLYSDDPEVAEEAISAVQEMKSLAGMRRILQMLREGYPTGAQVIPNLRSDAISMICGPELETAVRCAIERAHPSKWNLAPLAREIRKDDVIESVPPRFYETLLECRPATWSPKGILACIREAERLADTELWGLAGYNYDARPSIEQRSAYNTYRSYVSFYRFQIARIQEHMFLLGWNLECMMKAGLVSPSEERAGKTSIQDLVEEINQSLGERSVWSIMRAFDLDTSKGDDK